MRRLLVSIAVFFLFCTQVQAQFNTLHPSSTLDMPLPQGYSEFYEGTVWYEESAYHALVSLYPEGIHRTDIGYTTSTDGVVWSMPTIVIKRDTTTNPGRMIRDNGHLYLYFNELTSRGAKIVRIECENYHECLGDETDIITPTQHTWYSTDAYKPFIFQKDNRWYMLFTGGNGQWNLGLAQSDDGITWNVCPQPFFENAGNSSYAWHDGYGYVSFHYPDRSGITIRRANTLSCSTTWETVIQQIPPLPGSKHTVNPTLLWAKNTINLYYSWLNGNNQWVFARLEDSRPMIVIIPGYMGSWSKDGLLHNTEGEWRVPYFVHEYSGILQTLNNNGYQNGKDYILFGYDWRKNASETVTKLNKYLNDSAPSKQIVLIGHSYGGIIARAYASAYPHNVSQVITLGTPHEGTPHVYKPLSSGEIDRENSLEWLAIKIVLLLQNPLKSRRLYINDTFPSLRDMIPTYDFLYPSYGVPFINTYLPEVTIPQNIPAVSFGGNSEPTLDGYAVRPPSLLDKRFEKYLNGVPISSRMSPGDGVITSKSSQIGEYHSTSFSHSELITAKGSIAQIFQAASIPISPHTIVEGSKTNVTDALMYLVQSPVSISVSNGTTTWSEEDGIIYIPNPQGTYTLTIRANDKGNYRVLQGVINEDAEEWKSYEGTTEKNFKRTIKTKIKKVKKHSQ